MARFGSWTVLGASLLLSLGCGGQTNSDGSGGSGTGAASGGGGSPSGGAPSGGAGGCGPVDPGEPCSSLSEVECLAAHPRCAPVYDDSCCPECEPTGLCADCVNYQFFACVPFEESNCTPGTIPACGKTPSGICQGGSAQCPTEPPCNSVPGCVTATIAGCGPDQLCASECHPVTEWTCGPDCGQGPLPFCHAGVPETGPEGYTGYCIDSSACGACPAQQPVSGSLCQAPGASCQYGSWCAATCTCDYGVWTCMTPPC